MGGVAAAGYMPGITRHPVCVCPLRCKFFSLTETPEDYTIIVDEEGFLGECPDPPSPTPNSRIFSLPTVELPLVVAPRLFHHPQAL